MTGPGKKDKPTERFWSSLVRHRVIGFLPDREAETFGGWLRAHPEVKIVSRDRATAYANAVKRNAPQAQQVADRFHLLKNLREKLKEVIEHKHTCLPRMEESRGDGIPQAAQGQAACSYQIAF